MSNVRRMMAGLGLVVVLTGSGCSVKCTEHGLCFKPWFRVRVEINRTDEPGGKWARKHGVPYCESCGGGLGGNTPMQFMSPPIVGGGSMVTDSGETVPIGPISSGPLPTRFAPNYVGPLHHDGAPEVVPDDEAPIPVHPPIQTGPIPGGPPSTLHAKPIFNDGISYPITLPNEAPLIAPVPNQGEPVAPPLKTNQKEGPSSTQSQSAKKKPGSLRFEPKSQTGSNVFPSGKDIVFLIEIENTGELDIARVGLTASLTNGVAFSEVIRRAGASFDSLSVQANKRAQIEPRLVTFDPIENLTSTQKIVFEIKAKVAEGTTSGTLTVTAQSSAATEQTPVKKDFSFTIQ